MSSNVHYDVLGVCIRHIITDGHRTEKPAPTCALPTPKWNQLCARDWSIFLLLEDVRNVVQAKVQCNILSANSNVDSGLFCFSAWIITPLQGSTLQTIAINMTNIELLWLNLLSRKIATRLYSNIISRRKMQLTIYSSNSEPFTVSCIPYPCLHNRYINAKWLQLPRCYQAWYTGTQNYDFGRLLHWGDK